MHTVEVWIEGTAPLLQHRFHEHGEADDTDPPHKVAARSAYWDRDGTLFLPGGAFAQLLHRASKMDSRSRGTVASSAVIVLDDRVPLFALDRATRISHFEVDARSVVMPGGRRVLRYRPRIDSWCARVRVRIDELLVDPNDVRRCFDLGGCEIGVGDYRPERGGPFGTFAVVDWSEQQTAPAKAVA